MDFGLSYTRERPVASIIMAYDESLIELEPSPCSSTPKTVTREALSPLNRTPWPAREKRSAISLLSLPTEILDQILRYVLPYTFQCPRGIAWRRASRFSDITVAPLRTCRLLHQLSVAILYGENTFLLHTCYSGTEWKQIWGLPPPKRPNPVAAKAAQSVQTPANESDGIHLRGVQFRYTITPELGAAGTGAGLYSNRRFQNRLYPSTVFAFPDKLAGPRLQMIQRWLIFVALENEYTGKIKYGWSGPGLLDGVMRRVKELCKILQGCRSISKLEVILDIDVQPGEEGMPQELHAYLASPFENLPNLREGAFKWRYTGKKKRVA